MPATVTVMVFAYNHEAFIREALDSVLMQETDFPFEIAVLEDFSTDDTRRIVNEYAERSPWMIKPAYAPENRNDGRAWMDALAASKSDYIAVLDGDDYWTSSEKLQRQVDLLDAHPDWVMCGHDVTSMHNGQFVPSRAAKFEERPFYTAQDWSRSLFSQPAFGSVVFRRSVLPVFPEWFVDVPMGDLGLFLLLTDRGGKVGYIHEPLGVRRIHDGGMWSGADKAERASYVIRTYSILRTNMKGRHETRFRVTLAEGYYQLWEAKWGARAWRAGFDALGKALRLSVRPLGSRVLNAVLPRRAYPILRRHLNARAFR